MFDLSVATYFLSGIYFFLTYFPPLYEPSTTGPVDNRNSRIINFCERGDSCMDQSCEFSEAKHIKIRGIDCRFQEKCNRLNCIFKHNTEMKTFLGAGLRNAKGK